MSGVPLPAAVHLHALQAMGCPLPAAGTPLALGSGMLTPEAAASTYQSGLLSAGARIQARHADSLERSARAIVEEVQAFLARFPPPYARDMYAVTPEALIVFMETKFLPTHGRTHILNGDVVPAFSTVSNALSSLTRYFNLIGRAGEWTPPSTGNPCQSAYVRDWRTSYERFLWGEDVTPVAAAPISESRLRQLLRGYDATAAALDVPELALALTAARSARELLVPLLAQRDAAVVTYLRASWQRGGEGGRLRVCDLDPSPLTWFSGGQCSGDLTLPARVVISPNGTKCAQRRNAGSLVLVPDTGSPAMCCLHRIGRLLQTYSRLGLTLSPTAPIFLSCSSGGHHLAARAMSYGAIYRRLKGGLHQTRAGPAPQTPHSFRRTGLLSSTGDPAAGMSHALMRTPAVYHRYTDPARQERGG